MPPTVRAVGLDGIIYGAIVALWLCYLVPLALRRHDEAARSRSVDRFSSAMRVLGRTGSAATRTDEPVVRRRTLARSGHPRRAASVPAVPPAAARAAARAAAARRRRVLALLLGLTVAVTGVAVTGMLPLWSVAVPVATIVCFLVVAHLQVSRARTSTWERSLRTAAAEAPVAPTGDEPDEAPTVVLDAVLEEQRVVAAPVTTVDGRSLWDPLPVTLPTYVSKPRAERSYRTVDLQGEGAWTSGHLPPDAAADPAAEVAADGAAEGTEPASDAEVAAAPRAVGD